MKPRVPILVPFFLVFLLGEMPAQQAVFLTNPSFEDNPRYGYTPSGWRNCAFNDESPPDIHPVPEGEFRVSQGPADGETYLGLVVRQTRTVESIGQKLAAPLEPNRCYSLAVALSRSPTFISRKRSGSGTANFGQPAMLRIWGGISPCGQKSLLAESPLIDHTDWLKYTFHFQPLDSLSWISLEAWFAPGETQPYNGNLLVDDLSPIIPIDCNSLEPLLDPDTLRIPGYHFRKVETSGYKTHYFQPKEGGTASMSLRMVRNQRDLESLILTNCQDIGFVLGKRDFVNGQFTSLKEVAFNVSRFDGVILVAGLNNVGKKLTRKRMKALRNLFNETGLKKTQYRIVVDESAGKTGGWFCNQELWLKLEE
jgi:hypothetical protein